MLKFFCLVRMAKRMYTAYTIIIYWLIFTYSVSQHLLELASCQATKKLQPYMELFFCQVLNLFLFWLSFLFLYQPEDSILIMTSIYINPRILIWLWLLFISSQGFYYMYDFFSISPRILFWLRFVFKSALNSLILFWLWFAFISAWGFYSQYDSIYISEDF